LTGALPLDSDIDRLCCEASRVGRLVVDVRKSCPQPAPFGSGNTRGSSFDGWLGEGRRKERLGHKLGKDGLCDSGCKGVIKDIGE
jgi:hypothetical protein